MRDLTNKDIIQILKLTASLLELHGENDFKVRSYNTAAYNLERVEAPVSDMSLDELSGIDGIGKGIAARIHEINTTGSLSLLSEFLERTPQGIIDMLNIPGIGPKKIGVLWKTLQIESLEELLEACEAGKVAEIKGFGAKTQDNIKKVLEFTVSNSGKFHYSEAESLAVAFEKELKEALPNALISLSGQVRRKMEIIDRIELVIGADDIFEVTDYLDRQEFLEKSVSTSGPFTWRGIFIKFSLELEIWVCEKEWFYHTLLLQTGSQAHLAATIEEGDSLLKTISGKPLENEEEAYALAGLAYVPPEMREGLFEIELARENKIPELVEEADLSGILHNHSTYSDGKHSLEAMATRCKEMGYQYFGITDHSKTAVYAKGMDEQRVLKQLDEIDTLNKKLAPFKIFKGIESDILMDGSLDYGDEILSQFDFVVASIHAPLKMDEVTATGRLLKAISNPFTTILGHPTGRQLLRREGYPIDHKAVIDACARHGVIIEINANPWRLDLDWRWVRYAIEQNVLLSINPDAHDKEALKQMYYGVCVGRKGGLSADFTFNSFSLERVSQHFGERKKNALLTMVGE